MPVEAPIRPNISAAFGVRKSRTAAPEAVSPAPVSPITAEAGATQDPYTRSLFRRLNFLDTAAPLPLAPLVQQPLNTPAFNVVKLKKAQ